MLLLACSTAWLFEGLSTVSEQRAAADRPTAEAAYRNTAATCDVRAQLTDLMSLRRDHADKVHPA